MRIIYNAEHIPTNIQTKPNNQNVQKKNSVRYAKNLMNVIYSWPGIAVLKLCVSN